MRLIKNKSIMFICIVTTLILLFLTGYSAWVIINVKDNDTTPTYNYRDIIISAYRDNQSKVYNEGQLGPDAYIDGEIDTDNLIDVDQYEFFHRVQGSTDWVEDLPTNSGTYDIKIKNKADPNPDNPIIITFTINKAQPTLTANDINIFVNNDYEVQYSYDGDSEDVSIEYFDGENKIDKPTAVGTYKAIITISEGSNYLSVSKAININISDTLVIGPEHIQEIGTVEYEGSQIKPEPTIIVNGNVLVKDVDYEISYGDNLNVGPGSFTVIGKGNYGGEVTQYFTIGWKYLTPQDLAINYNATYRTFDQIKTNQILTNTTNDTGDIVSGLILKDSSGNIYGGESLISITNMHNGLYGYGTFEVNPSPYTATTNVVGSTYYVSISITNDNYKLTEDYFILKYQTAMIDENYYTIEDSLFNSTSSSLIILAGSNSGTDYVITSFSSLDRTLTGYNDEKYYTLSCKLRVPFDSENLDFHGAGGLTNVEGSTDGCTEGVAITTKNVVYSVMMIPNKTITLTITESGILNIGGLIAGSGDVSNRGVVMNNGYINAENGSKIYSYGYLKGTGLITADGATITDVFRMWDWKGGAYSSGMNNVKVFPLNAYSMHNISCDTKILPGTSYESFWTVMFNNKLYQGFQRGDSNGNIEIIGSTGMFNLTSGYIIKSASNSIKDQTSTDLLDITGDNQIKGQKDIIKIYGTCTDNSVRVSIKASGTSFDMTSSKEMPLPVGFMDVIIGADGANVGHLTLNAVSYKFYPGSSIFVENGGKLTLNDDVVLNMFNVNDAITDQSKTNSPFITASSGTVIDRYDAYITVDGVLELKSGSSLGGKIYTVNSTGKLILSGNISAAVNYITSADSVLGGLSYRMGTGTKNMDIKLYMYNQQTKSISSELSTPIQGKTYYAVNGGWVLTNAVISFDLNGGISDSIASQTVTANNDASRGFLLTEEYLIQFVPTKTGYTFGGWYFSTTFTDENSAEGQMIYSDVTLYANWIVNQYEIIFDTDGGNDINSVLVDYGAPIILPNNPTKDGYTFKGWDLNNDGQVDPVATMTMPANDLCLKALWATEVYTITFDSNGGTAVEPIDAEAGDNIEWNSRSIPVKTGYIFKGWDYDGDGLDDRNSLLIMPAENINVIAIWIQAYTITLNANGGEIELTSLIVEKDSTVILPTPSRNGYNFKGWYTSSTDGTKVNGDDGSYTPTEDITLYAQWSAFVVTYDANGGTCTTSLQTYEGKPLTLPTPTRTDYTFNGWYTAKSGGRKVGDGGATYTPDGDITLYAQWTQNKDGGCLAEGTLITMADGTKKKVEDLVYGDKVLVFNHETGKFEISTLIFNAHKDELIAMQDVVNLHFSNGVVLRIVAHHGIFDLTLNEYVEISKDNVNDFIGHEFTYVSYVNGQYVCESVVLTDYQITEEYIKVYSPITANQINCFAEGFLTAPGLYNRLMNIFEYDDNMTIDVAKKQEDIEKYGLYDYSVFEEYVSYEIYQAFNGQYFRVAVEKGIITLDEIIQIILDFNIKDSTGIK